MSEDKPAFKRILLKLSGEALKGEAEHGIVPEAVEEIALRIRSVTANGVQVALVVGAGNIFRGLPASRKGIQRNTADYMGMMATVMNALALGDALESVGVSATIQTPAAIPGVTDEFHFRRAVARLDEGAVVIFAGGTGHPFFTTDTTAALRACEVGADAVFKATNVDGVYSADPRRDPAAERYETLSYDDAIQRRLGVMDATAFSLCRENGIPIVVFNFSAPEALGRAAFGDVSCATLVSDCETVIVGDS